MKKKEVRKLTLNKETLERLDDQTLTRFGVRSLGEAPSDSLPQCCGGTD
ncbi:MAG: class I lanthipeptide [Thermoanaerobaculia bacterium]